jgi:hypothetical protein
MAYDPPRGRELAAINQIIKLVERIEETQSALTHAASQVLNDADNVHWCITERHALDGVRTNGTGHLTSLATIMLGVRRIRKRHAGLKRDIARELRRLDALLAAAEKIVGPFTLCSECKGEGGREGVVRSIGSITRWHDCAACAGRGLKL